MVIVIHFEFYSFKLEHICNRFYRDLVKTEGSPGSTGVISGSRVKNPNFGLPVNSESVTVVKTLGVAEPRRCLL